MRLLVACSLEGAGTTLSDGAFRTPPLSKRSKKLICSLLDTPGFTGLFDLFMRTYLAMRCSQSARQHHPRAIERRVGWLSVRQQGKPPPASRPMSDAPPLPTEWPSPHPCHHLRLQPPNPIAAQATTHREAAGTLKPPQTRTGKPRPVLGFARADYALVDPGQFNSCRGQALGRSDSIGVEPSQPLNLRFHLSALPLGPQDKEPLPRSWFWKAGLRSGRRQVELTAWSEAARAKKARTSAA